MCEWARLKKGGRPARALRDAMRMATIDEPAGADLSAEMDRFALGAAPL
jgi:hypothetical protein